MTTAAEALACLKAQTERVPGRVAVDPETLTPTRKTHSAQQEDLLLGLLDVVHGDVQMHLAPSIK